MVNTIQMAIIKKDMRAIIFNKRLFPVLLIIPLIFTVLLPSMFILIVHFMPDAMEGFQQILSLVPGFGNTSTAIIDLILNRVMPIFFMLIPIMSASVMAANSFIGEKEKHTLETLLYSPISLKQLFQAKVFASFGTSMLVSIASFVIMLIVVGIEVLLTSGVFFLPGINWLITMLLLSPAISIIVTALIVRGSAKAQTVEESQQRAGFLILPLLALIVGQFTGIIFISAWLLLALGVVCAALAIFMLRRSLGKYDYETLLQ